MKQELDMATDPEDVTHMAVQPEWLSLCTRRIPTALIRAHTYNVNTRVVCVCVYEPFILNNVEADPACDIGCVSVTVHTDKEPVKYGLGRLYFVIRFHAHGRKVPGEMLLHHYFSRCTLPTFAEDLDTFIAELRWSLLRENEFLLTRGVPRDVLDRLFCAVAARLYTKAFFTHSGCFSQHRNVAQEGDV